MSLDDTKENHFLNDEFKSEIINLIHFIRTPLASIKIGSKILKDIFPMLVSTYKSYPPQVESSDIPISNERLEKLSLIIDGIIKESNRISDYIQAIELK